MYVCMYAPSEAGPATHRPIHLWRAPSASLPPVAHLSAADPHPPLLLLSPSQHFNAMVCTTSISCQTQACILTKNAWSVFCGVGKLVRPCIVLGSS